MKKFAFALALAAALPAAPAAAQIAPGMRAPTSVADGVVQAWLMGCYFAATERPAAGLNMGVEMGGAGLHMPDSIPDDLAAMIAPMPDRIIVAVLDAPGGQLWMLFDPEDKRCMIVPTPVAAEGIEAQFLDLMRTDWNQVPREGGGVAFEQEFEAVRSLRRPGGKLRAWYQAAAGPAQPQMIVVERIR